MEKGDIELQDLRNRESHDDSYDWDNYWDDKVENDDIDETRIYKPYDPTSPLPLNDKSVNLAESFVSEYEYKVKVENIQYLFRDKLLTVDESINLKFINYLIEQQDFTIEKSFIKNKRFY